MNLMQLEQLAVRCGRKPMSSRIESLPAVRYAQHIAQMAAMRQLERKLRESRTAEAQRIKLELDARRAARKAKSSEARKAAQAVRREAKRKRQLQRLIAESQADMAGLDNSWSMAACGERTLSLLIAWQEDQAAVRLEAEQRLFSEDEEAWQAEISD